MRKTIILTLMVVFGFSAYPLKGHCAETVHLYLKANGQSIKGKLLNGAIPCVSFAGGASGPVVVNKARRNYQPIVIHKIIDQSSPLIYKALTQDQRIEAEFKFFRTNPDGSMTLVKTVAIKDARISSVKRLGSAAPGQPAPLEEVTFTYQTISWPPEAGHVTSYSNRTTAAK